MPAPPVSVPYFIICPVCNPAPGIWQNSPPCSPYAGHLMTLTSPPPCGFTRPPKSMSPACQPRCRPGYPGRSDDSGCTQTARPSLPAIPPLA